MTLFIDVSDLSRLLQQVGISRFLSELADTIQSDFCRWDAFDKSARTAAHSPVGVIELMPIADAARYAFKYVNGHPDNPQRGLPTVMAFGVLAEVATGVPLLLSELTLTTALRTAATSVVAARALARKGARRMALIGNGAQSEFQAVAFHVLLGIDELAVFDTDVCATDKLVRNLAAYPGLRITRAASITDALAGADIVTTVTADKTCATIVTPAMLEPGMHLNAVGGDCPGKTELHPDVLRAGRVFVEYAPQTRIEGDIQQMPADFPVEDLWRVLAGSAPGRRTATEITIFDSVGFALEDYSALRYVHAQALALGIGQRIGLVPPAQDPKDLFRLTYPHAVQSVLPPQAQMPEPRRTA